VSITCQLLYPCGRTPCCLLNRRLEGLQSQSRYFGKEKTLFSCLYQKLNTVLPSLQPGYHANYVILAPETSHTYCRYINNHKTNCEDKCLTCDKHCTLFTTGEISDTTCFCWNVMKYARVETVFCNVMKLFLLCYQ
jgi:hypothetical protein